MTIPSLVSAVNKVIKILCKRVMSTIKVQEDQIMDDDNDNNDDSSIVNS